MANTFVSDFSIKVMKVIGGGKRMATPKPIGKNDATKKDNEFAKATWPESAEQEIHKLYNREIDGPVIYIRKKISDQKDEECRVMWQNNTLVMKPSRGHMYKIRIDSMNNIKNNDDNNVNTKELNILQKLNCINCDVNKRTYIFNDCKHFVTCRDCAVEIFNNDKRCILCNHYMYSCPKQLYF